MTAGGAVLVGGWCFVVLAALASIFVARVR